MRTVPLTLRYLFIIAILCLISCAGNLEIRKKQERAIKNLAEEYLRQGNYITALKELLNAEKIYAKDPELQNLIGTTYLIQNNPELAIIHLKKALRLNSEFAPAKNNLGTAYMAKKDWDAAIKCYKELTSNMIYVTPHYALLNMGFAYYNKKDYKLSEKYYREALRKKPDYIKALIGAGRTEVKLNRLSEAESFLLKADKTIEKSLKKEPKAAVLYLELARAYKLSGNNEFSREAYKKFIILLPDNPLIYDAKKELNELEDNLINIK